MPGVSNDESQERIDFVRHLLAINRYKSAVKRLFRKKYPDTDASTIEHLLARAKAAMLEDAARSRSELRAELRERLEDVSQGKAAPRDRIRAAEVMGKLFGLNLEIPPIEIICDDLGCTRRELVEAIELIRERKRVVE